MARAFDGLEPAARDLRERLAVGVGRDLVVGAVDHQDRAAHALGERGLIAPGGGGREPAGSTQAKRRSVGVVRPGDRVLDLFGGVRLGKHPLRPPLDEVAVAAVAPVVEVVLGPPTLGERRPGQELAEERPAHRAQAQRPPAGRKHGADEHHGLNALRVIRSQQQPALRAHREPDTDRAVDAAGVHDVDRVLGELGLVVGADLARAVGAAVAARVEADDPEVPGEIGDLRLPHARVHERPCRQEQDRLLALPVGLPEDAHPVALDEPFLVGIARAALLARVRGCRFDGGHRFVLRSRDSSQRSIQSRRGLCPSSIPSRRSSA